MKLAFLGIVFLAFFLYNSFICGVKSCVNFTGKKKQFLDLLFHLVFQIICPSDNDRKRKKEKKLRSKIYSNSRLWNKASLHKQQ